MSELSELCYEFLLFFLNIFRFILPQLQLASPEMSLLTSQSKFKLFWFLTQGNKLQSNTNCKNIQHCNSVSWNLSLQSSLVSVFISTNQIPSFLHKRWIPICKQFCPGVLVHLCSHRTSWSVFPLSHPSERKSLWLLPVIFHIFTYNKHSSMTCWKIKLHTYIIKLMYCSWFLPAHCEVVHLHNAAQLILSRFQGLSVFFSKLKVWGPFRINRELWILQKTKIINSQKCRITSHNVSLILLFWKTDLSYFSTLFFLLYSIFIIF